MAEKTGDFFVCSLAPLEKGDTFTEWPLHVTVVPYFSIPQNLENAFQNSVSNLMHNIRPFKVNWKEYDSFGDNNDVPVRLVSSLGALSVLHDRLCSIIAAHSGTIDSRYIAAREGFNPHVTLLRDEGVDLSEIKTLSHLQRIRQLGGEAVVLSSLPFSKNEGVA